jgi:hypothetical protein
LVDELVAVDDFHLVLELMVVGERGSRLFDGMGGGIVGSGEQSEGGEDEGDGDHGDGWLESGGWFVAGLM